jgi:hypothetical protein
MVTVLKTQEQRELELLLGQPGVRQAYQEYLRRHGQSPEFVLDTKLPMSGEDAELWLADLVSALEETLDPGGKKKLVVSEDILLRHPRR